VEWLANAFKEVAWPILPTLQMGGGRRLLAKGIKDAPENAKLAVVRERLGDAYSG
jgi:hypothetical protein